MSKLILATNFIWKCSTVS